MERVILIMVLALSAVSSFSQKQNYAVPSGFTPNLGQVLYGSQDSRPIVKYYTDLGGVRIFFRNTGYSYVVFKYPDLNRSAKDYHEQLQKHPVQQYRIDVEFVGANSTSLIEQQIQNVGFKNFYHTSINQPILAVSSFKQITYKNIYNGIDLMFTLNNEGLKYDFIVAPGADASNIKMKYSEPISLSNFEDERNNELSLKTPIGDIIDQAPISTQLGSNVPTYFQLNTNNTISFNFPEGYNKQQQLVIDPAIVWSSYLGGNDVDEIHNLSVDNSKNVMVCGFSKSVDFPQNGTWTPVNFDFMVAKFTDNGAYAWGTLDGGNENDNLTSICSDALGGIYVTGYSNSADVTFSSGYQPNVRGSIDIVVIKYDATTGKRITGSFYGESSEDVAYGIALDYDGYLVIVGKTSSNNLQLNSPLIGIFSGKYDAFVMRWKASTLQPFWASYYGGKGEDIGFSVATDERSNIYISGYTNSTLLQGMNSTSLQQFISDQTISINTDCFILSLTKGGSIRWATFYGENGSEEGYNIHSKLGLVSVTGLTTSALLKMYGSNVLPFNSLTDGFVLTTDTTGKPVWSTFLGGSQVDIMKVVRIGQDTSINVSGFTFSRDFPLLHQVNGDIKNKTQFSNDITLTKFSTKGKLLWSTYLGGNGDDALEYGSGDIDALGNIYLGFYTDSDVIALKNAQFNKYKGKTDAYITKICPSFAQTTILKGDSVFCDGNSITLSSGVGLTNVKWSPDGQLTPSITVTKSGKYSYTADAGPECSGLNSDTITVRTRPGIKVVTDSIGTLRLCQGKSVKLYSKTKYKTYQWLDATGSVVSTTDTVTISNAGSYHLIVVDSTGCTGSSSNVDISVYPKPDINYRIIVNNTIVIDSIFQYNNLCFGDTVVVLPMYAVNNKPIVVWKDNSLSPQFNITKTDSTFATFSDANNCQWILPEIKFYFQVPSTPVIKTIDTTCIGSDVLLNATTLGFSDIKYEWLTDGAEFIDGVTDSANVHVRWKTAGLKQVRVRGANGVRCVDTSLVKNIFVESQVKGKIVTTGNQLLCNNEFVQLHGPDGFASYLWSNSVNTKSINVSTPGQYIVQFNNDRGCSGFDTIVIGKRLVFTTTPVANNFGTVTINQSSQQRLVIYNFSKEKINLLTTLNDGRHFQIDSTMPTLSDGVKTADSLILYVSFVPKNINLLRDTIKVVITQPCPDTVYFTLSGTGLGVPPTPILRFRVHDVAIQPLQDTVHIPIDAWLEPNVATLSLDTLIFTLAYNPTIFRISGATKGTTKTIFNTRPLVSYATVSVPLSKLSLTPVNVTEVIADVLLGDKENDSLYVSTADVAPYSPKAINTIGGEVVYSALCKEGGSRLLSQSQKPVLLLFPNPSTDDVSIITSDAEKGNASLLIYDSHGELVWSASWLAYPKNTIQHRLNTSIPSGIYQVVYRTPSQSINDRLVVIK